MNPLMLAVPLGDMKETDLMASLEFVVKHWAASDFADRTNAKAEISRSVQWLNAKYGPEGGA